MTSPLSWLRRWLSGEDMGANQEQHSDAADASPDSSTVEREAASEHVDVPVSREVLTTGNGQGRRQRIAALQVRGVDDAQRHGEELLRSSWMPVITELETSRSSRIAELAILRQTRAGQLDQRVVDAEQRVKAASAALDASEAGLREAGVPEDQLALDPPTERSALGTAALAVAVGAASAGVAFAFNLSTAQMLIAALVAAAAFVICVSMGANAGEAARITRLQRSRSQALSLRDGAQAELTGLKREREQLPALIAGSMRFELEFASELLAAYESAVLSALPPGSLADAGNDLPTRALSPLDLPFWADEEGS